MLKYKNKLLAILLSVLLVSLSGCNHVSNTDEMLELLAKCEEMFKEECSFIPVPNSAEAEMQEMYSKWKKAN